jgi:hypothetical protein
VTRDTETWTTDETREPSIVLATPDDEEYARQVDAGRWTPEAARRRRAWLSIGHFMLAMARFGLSLRRRRR